jgi:hypothetical protein
VPPLPDDRSLTSVPMTTPPNAFLNIGNSRWAVSVHGVLCSPTLVRGAGSSSRARKTPPAVSTLEPTNHRDRLHGRADLRSAARSASIVDPVPLTTELIVKS